MSEFSIHIQSHIGGRSDNQDCYASKETALGLLIVVCDGMGGAAGGKIAADMACKIVTNNFSKLREDLVDGIATSIKEANNLVYAKSKTDPELHNMGTTLAALLLEKGNATFFHVGDSRIYQIRNGRVEKRTSDHSKVGEMVKRGILNDEQARLSVESNIISKALGIAPEIDVEITNSILYQKGDRFAVCTDGIWGALPEDALVKAWSESKPVEYIANQLIQEINTNQVAAGGGHDNMTLALTEVIKAGGNPTIISSPRFLNIVLFIALMGCLAYILVPKPGSNANSGNQKNDTTSKGGLKDSAISANSPRTYIIDQGQLQRLKAMMKKLQAATQKDTTGKIKPVVNELSKEISKIR